jgi:hypothetical protein
MLAADWKNGAKFMGLSFFTSVLILAAWAGN